MSERALDISKSASIIADRMQDEFEFYCYNEATKLARSVESEIELILLLAFCMASRLGDMKIVVGNEIPEGVFTHLLITPQYKWENYRIDFRIQAGRGNPFVFVECDGHDFHGRTKEQAERDRSKDRAIQSAGIPILRFTGREIWRAPDRCMVEIIKFITGLDKK